MMEMFLCTLVAIGLTIGIIFVAVKLAVNSAADGIGLRESVDYEQFVELVNDLDNVVVVVIDQNHIEIKLAISDGGWKIHALALHCLSFR